MSWLTRVSLRNRSVVALIVVAIIIVGVFAVGRLRQELMPNIEFPALTIFTMEPGASPADVEKGVTTPLEGAIKGSAGLKTLDSYSNEGMSIIVAQYEYGTDMAKVKADVQSAVGRVQPYLPTGVAPQVATVNFGDVPVVQLAVTSSAPPEELAALLQAKAVPKLQQIDGVAAVSLSGLQGSRVDVALQPAALAQYGISPTAIVAALTSANVSIPAGTVVSDGTDHPGARDQRGGGHRGAERAAGRSGADRHRLGGAVRRTAPAQTARDHAGGSRHPRPGGQADRGADAGDLAHPHQRRAVHRHRADQVGQRQRGADLERHARPAARATEGPGRAADHHHRRRPGAVHHLEHLGHVARRPPGRRSSPSWSSCSSCAAGARPWSPACRSR